MSKTFQQLPKIGKRGWFGVVLVVAGLSTAAGITGHETGSRKTEQFFNAMDSDGSLRRVAEDVTAELQGYKSAADKRATQGATCIVFGSVLIIWGYKKYNVKSGSNT